MDAVKFCFQVLRMTEECGLFSIYKFTKFTYLMYVGFQSLLMPPAILPIGGLSCTLGDSAVLNTIFCCVPFQAQQLLANWDWPAGLFDAEDDLDTVRETQAAAIDRVDGAVQGSMDQIGELTRPGGESNTSRLARFMKQSSLRFIGRSGGAKGWDQAG